MATDEFLDVQGWGRAHYLRYESSKTGALPLILVHPLLADAATWTAIAHLLSENFTVLALNLPGHGQTAPAAKPIGLEEAGVFLSDFVAALKPQDYVLGGTSMGAAIITLANGHLKTLPRAHLLVSPLYGSGTVRLHARAKVLLYVLRMSTGPFSFVLQKVVDSDTLLRKLLTFLDPLKMADPYKSGQLMARFRVCRVPQLRALILGCLSLDLTRAASVYSPAVIGSSNLDETLRMQQTHEGYQKLYHDLRAYPLALPHDPLVPLSVAFLRPLAAPMLAGLLQAVVDAELTATTGSKASFNFKKT